MYSRQFVGKLTLLGVQLAYAAALAGQTVPAAGPATQTETAPPVPRPLVPRSGVKLSIWEALERAERNNPQLKVAVAQRESAVASIQTAKQYPNPTISAVVGPQYSKMSNAGRGPSGLLQAYSVTQQLELPSLRTARREAAEKAVVGTELGIDGARLSLRGTVKQTFYQVLRHRGEVEVATENLRLIEDLRKRIETQVSVGEAARLELVRAEAEVATARTLMRSAQLREVTALALLRSSIGARPDEVLDPAGALDSQLALPALDSLRDGMLDRHPLLLQAKADVATAEAKLKTEVVARKPQPSVYTDYEHQPDLGFVRFGVQVPLPVWNKREGPIAEAVAERNRLRAVQQVKELQLVAALEQAYGQYQVSSQQLESFRQGVLREAEAALQAAEAAFRFGERGIIEVLDAQRVLRSVRLDYLSAQYDLQASLIDLEQLRAIDTVNNP